MDNRDIRIEESDLASRTSARELRRTIRQKLTSDPCIRIDLSAVKSISDSYADELFGVLSAEIGLEPFLSKVKIIGCSKHLTRVIASNIRNRTSVAA